MRFIAIAVVGLAVLLVAAPADAQSRRQRNDDRDNSDYRSSTWQGWQSRQSGRTADIYINGRNMGTDPDSRVRAYIQRDNGAAFPGPD